MNEYVIHQGDCLEVLSTLSDNSIDSIVTDPPYELGFMGKGWDKSGIANNVQVWAECLRVLKPGGHLLAFSGSRTYHRMTCAIEDAGLEVRDQIMWIYGSGFPKSKNLGGDWQGWGTALKPAHEPICVARKQMIGTVSQNVLTHGTGALNIDGCRVEGESTRRTNTAEMGYHGGNIAGEYQTGSEAGRWPANVIHDGSEEVLSAFPDAPGQMARARTDGEKQGNNTYSSLNHVTYNPDPRIENDKSAARFYYCAKANKSDRGEGNNHPTVKPTELMRYLVRLVTPTCGTVLDPFTGSGSTGKACMLEGFRFVGIELDSDYIEIALARIQHALNDAKPASPIMPAVQLEMVI